MQHEWDLSFKTVFSWGVFQSRQVRCAMFLYTRPTRTSMGPPSELAYPLCLLIELASLGCCQTPERNNNRCSIMINMMNISSLIVYACVLIIKGKYSNAHEHAIMHEVPILSMVINHARQPPLFPYKLHSIICIHKLSKIISFVV